jgi:hypothetical protein
MCGVRFPMSASDRQEGERPLKTAQHRGQVRQVTSLLPILAVRDGQSGAPVAWVLRGHEKTVATWRGVFCG